MWKQAILLVLVVAAIIPYIACAQHVYSYELPRVLVVYDDYEVNVTRPGLPSRTAIMINYVVPVAFSLMSQLPSSLNDFNVIVFDTSIGEYVGVSNEYINLIARIVRSGKPVIILGRGFSREQLALLTNITGMFFETAGKYNMQYYVKPRLSVYPEYNVSVRSDKMDRDVWYAINSVLSQPGTQPIIEIGGGYLLAARNNNVVVILLSVDDTVILRDEDFWANIIYGLLGAPKPWPRIPAYFDYATSSVCSSMLILAFHDYPTTVELDIIEKYGFRVSMFLISGFYDKWSYMLPRLQRLVSKNLVDIIPHSLKHADMKSDRDALTDLVLSRMIFLQLFAKDYIMMAPSGNNQTQIRFYEEHVEDVNPYVAARPVRGYSFVYFVEGEPHIGSPSGPIPTLVYSGETPLYTDLQRIIDIVDKNLAYHRTIVIDIHPDESYKVYWSDIMEKLIPMIRAKNVCPTTMSQIIQYGWDRFLVHVNVSVIGDAYVLTLWSREPVLVPILFDDDIEYAVDSEGRVLAWITGKILVVYVNGTRVVRVKTGVPRIGPVTGVVADLPYRSLVNAYIDGDELVIEVHRDNRLLGNSTVTVRIGTAETVIPAGVTMRFVNPRLVLYNVTLLTYDGVPIADARVYIAGYPLPLTTNDKGVFAALVPSFVNVYVVFAGQKHVLNVRNGTVKLDVVRILFPNTYARVIGSKIACYSYCYLPRTTVKVFVLSPTSRGLRILDLSNARSNTLYTDYVVVSGIYGDPGSLIVVIALVASVALGIPIKLK